MKKVSVLFLTACLYFPQVQGNFPEKNQATIRYLQELQTPEGGFLQARPDPGTKKSEAPSLRGTSGALRALNYLGCQVYDRKTCVKFVQNCRDLASGGFADHPGGKPDVITTATGIMAAVELKLPVTEYGDAVVRYLGENARSFEEIRMAAAGLETVGRLPPQAKTWREQILRMENPDGTFGKGDGIPRNTAGAVVTLMRIGGTLEHRESVVKILKGGQRNDGGYGKENSAASDLESSYRVVRALEMLNEKPTDREGFLRYVDRCRNADGGFGLTPGNPSNITATYFAATLRHWLLGK